MGGISPMEYWQIQIISIPKAGRVFFFYSVLQTGRIFGNTLPFVAALACLGMYVNKKYHTTAVELFALGSLIHIALDQVWKVPQTLFWPLLRWEFPKYDLEDYLVYILNSLFTHPDAYIPEIIGIVILFWFIVYFKLYKLDNIKSFMKSGNICF